MAQSIMDDVETVLDKENTNDSFPMNDNGARIKVFGVGGGGGNAVQHMIDSGLQGVEFICANTDMQALRKNHSPTKLQLGEKLTRGRGAGANPKIGHDAAEESKNAIRDAIGDAEMVFVTAGMGGGTGTGAAPVIAQTAQEQGALTVGVVTKPFSWEGSPRHDAAEAGLSELKEHVDCLITIPNDRLLTFAPKKAAFKDMLQKSNDVLYCAVKGISDAIVQNGLINVDFADVRTVMSESGMALMGTGVATGENRAREAAQRAISSPLLEDVSLESARAVMYNITASDDITAAEVDEIGQIISNAAPQGANIIFGVVFDNTLGDELHLTVIATGIEPTQSVQPEPEAQPVKIIPMPHQRAHEPGAQTSRRSPDLRVQGRLFPVQPSSGASDVDYPIADGYGNLDVPAYSRRPRKAYPLAGAGRQHPHTPGANDFTFDNDEMEIPTFIRMQAD